MYGDEAVYPLILRRPTPPLILALPSTHSALSQPLEMALPTSMSPLPPPPSSESCAPTISQPPDDHRPRRAHRPRPGFDIDDVKMCTGCGKNAKGDDNVIRCKNINCSTEWVCRLFQRLINSYLIELTLLYIVPPPLPQDGRSTKDLDL